MTSPSRSGASRRFHLVVQICGYIAAVLLPWVGVTFSIHTPALRGTPLALSFVLVAGITLFTSLGPGLVSVVLTALFFNHLALARNTWLSLTSESLLYTIVILVIGTLVAFLCDRQRVIGSDLRAALASLRVRTNALMEACLLYTSRCV